MGFIDFRINPVSGSIRSPSTFFTVTSIFKILMNGHPTPKVKMKNGNKIMYPGKINLEAMTSRQFKLLQIVFY